MHWKITLVLALTLALSGCARQEIVLNQGPSVLTKEQTSHFFLGGIMQEDQIDAGAVCGGADKVAKVEMEEDGLSVVFQWLLGLLYTPRSIAVYCLSDTN